MPEIVEVQVGDPGGFARIRPAIEASTQNGIHSGKTGKGLGHAKLYFVGSHPCICQTP
jgi:hypothetical protein